MYDFFKYNRFSPSTHISIIVSPDFGGSTCQGQLVRVNLSGSTCQGQLVRVNLSSPTLDFQPQISNLRFPTSDGQHVGSNFEGHLNLPVTIFLNINQSNLTKNLKISFNIFDNDYFKPKKLTHMTSKKSLKDYVKNVISSKSLSNLSSEPAPEPASKPASESASNSASDPTLTTHSEPDVKNKDDCASSDIKTKPKEEKLKNNGDILIESLLKSIRSKQKIHGVAYVDDPLCDGHRLISYTETEHQESNTRTKAVRKAIDDFRLTDFIERAGSIDVKKHDLSSVHKSDYVDIIFECGKKNKPVHIPPPSVEVSMSNMESLGSVLAAVASVKGGVDVVCGKYEMKKLKKRYHTPRIRKVFCNVRPPGHHAHTNRGSGFCFMNNVAIGAQFALNKYSKFIKKVLIFDWDLHHGDGTQEIFGDNPNIMHCSFHRGGKDHDAFYPFTGLVRSNEAGNIINFPIGYDESVESYMKKFTEEFLPMAYKFDPDLVMISAGFDSHKDDLYHQLPLDYIHFAEMTKALCKLADECALGRLVSVLEGGYTSDVLYRCAAVHIATMVNGYDD
jgi:acetoin utilization deacetylase AcuC-like enzyme